MRASAKPLNDVWKRPLWPELLSQSLALIRVVVTANRGGGGDYIGEEERGRVAFLHRQLVTHLTDSIFSCYAFLPFLVSSAHYKTESYQSQLHYCFYTNRHLKRESICWKSYPSIVFLTISVLSPHQEFNFLPQSAVQSLALRFKY